MKKFFKFIGFNEPTAEEYADRELEKAKLEVAKALDGKAYAEAMIAYRRKQIEIYHSVIGGNAFIDQPTNSSERNTVAVREQTGNLSS